MQAIYDAIDAELTVEVADADARGLQRYGASLMQLRQTMTQGMGFLTADTLSLDDLIVRVHRLDAAIDDVSEGSVVGDALANRMQEIAADAAENARAASPVDSGLLRDYGIRADKLQREKRQMVARVLAHARGKERYNYAWFTEVGTQNHAVDELGYEHSTKRAPGNQRGIPAQHWFERSTASVFDDAEEVMTSVLERVVSTVLG